jgi:hypothetical protein
MRRILTRNLGGLGETLGIAPLAPYTDLHYHAFALPSKEPAEAKRRLTGEHKPCSLTEVPRRILAPLREGGKGW